MAFIKLSLPAIVGIATALPQISLPSPLIPTIPGVTEPLSSDAPPLPILQLPTPPLPDPGYTPSDIRPEKIGYFWTASGDNEHADFLASYSLDDDTFGTLLRVAEVPTSGNSPHHLGSCNTSVCHLRLLMTIQAHQRMANISGVAGCSRY